MKLNKFSACNGDKYNGLQIVEKIHIGSPGLPHLHGFICCTLLPCSTEQSWFYFCA